MNSQGWSVPKTVATGKVPDVHLALDDGSSHCRQSVSCVDPSLHGPLRQASLIKLRIREVAVLIRPHRPLKEVEELVALDIVLVKQSSIMTDSGTLMKCLMQQKVHSSRIPCT